jgi:hypothetical protein
LLLAGCTRRDAAAREFAEFDSVLVGEGSAPLTIRETGCIYFVYSFEKIAILPDFRSF